MSKLTHPPVCYDEYFVLRVSPPLWLALAWSINHAFLLLFGAFAHSGEVFGLIVEYAWSPLLLTDIPGLLVFIARFKRNPAAGPTIRWIWRHGRILLLSGFGLSIALTLALKWTEVVNMDNIAILSLSLNVLFGFYVFASRLVKDIFDDFPEAVSDTKKEG